MGGLPRAFGALRVHARIGTSDRRTSVFPQDATRSWVLSVERSVRHAAPELGDVVPVLLQLHP